VRDTVGAPLAGVDVSVQGIARTATTTPKGTFEFSGVKLGPTAVTVRRLGYAPQSIIVRIVDGDNTLPDFVLTAVPRELDTVMTREQQLWRDRPLLREMEENRKLGLGQFITRAELAKNQGGFLSPMVAQKRGLVVVRHKHFANRFWLANKYVPSLGTCADLEDGSRSTVTPPEAVCGYCFPAVYLDYARLTHGQTVPNLGQFNPDQLEAIEIYLGAAETPVRYASGMSSCGVIVLHTRALDLKPRVIAVKQDSPTRSRVFANASVSTGASCLQCDKGRAADVSLGYTLRDRWVLAGRYAGWTNFDGGAQDMQLYQALVEWYPRRDPGRIKWFVNAGLGLMSVDINTATENPARDHFDATERFVKNAMPSAVVGTGVDVSVIRRFVVTPFFSFTRSFLGDPQHTSCVNVLLDDGTYEWQCFGPVTEPGTFNLKQLGLRFGWR
jgi:hypothetical protein